MVRRFYGRVGLAVVLLVGVTSLFFLYSWPIEIDPTSQVFLEDQRCPACYGQDLCHEVHAGRLTLKRWTRYAHKNNYFCEFMVLQESAIYLFFRCCFSVTQKEVVNDLKQRKEEHIYSQKWILRDVSRGWGQRLRLGNC